MLDDIRLTDNDYLRREQDMTQRCAGEEQIETSLLDLRVPGLRI
jgi:hypothetical protein